ncbi:MAG: hypothetical protein R3C61_28335 [Bacteroidia bacterium]
MFEQQQLELILNRLKDYGQTIRRWRWLIIAGALAIGGLLGLFAHTSAVYFKAVTIFHPEISGQQNAGLRANPLSFILGGSGKEGSEASLMMGILKSRNITEAVAGDSIDFHGEKILVADAVFKAFPKSISPVAVYRRIFFPSPVLLPLEKKVTVIGQYFRDHMEIETTEEGFIEFDFSFVNEELVKILSERCMVKLDEYYRNQKTEKAKQNYLFFEYRADSVKKELDKANRSVARYYDETKFGVKASNEVFLRDQEAKIKLLTELYIELEISKEQAKAQYQKETPVIQILDVPNPPYEKEERSAPLFAIIGFLAAAVLLVIFFTRKLWMEDIGEVIQSQLIKKPQDQVSEEGNSTEE